MQNKSKTTTTGKRNQRTAKLHGPWADLGRFWHGDDAISRKRAIYTRDPARARETTGFPSFRNFRSGSTGSQYYKPPASEYQTRLWGATRFMLSYRTKLLCLLIPQTSAVAAGAGTWRIRFLRNLAGWQLPNHSDAR